MAKIKLGNVDPKALTTALGSVYIRDTKWGAVVQSKPKYSKAKRTQLQQDYIDRFTFAGRMAATPEPLSYQTATYLSEGTEQVPRDVLTMAALGRYYTFVLPDGTEMLPAPGPVANTRPEVANSMWEWSQWDAAWTATMDATATATKGVMFTPLFNDPITSVRAIFTTVNLAIYQLSVGIVNGSNVIQSLTKSNSQIANGALLQCMQFDLNYTFNAGSRTFLAVTRTDLLATTALSININQAKRWLYPLTNLGTCRVASNNLATGQTFTIVAAANASPFGFRINQ